jgi:hypothetical protein
MSLWSALFGGPSQQEKNLASSEQNLAGAQTNAFNEQLANAFGSESQVAQELRPVLNLGPNAQGFSSAELAAMNSQAINQAGAAARNSQQYIGGVLAGRGGGGSSGLTSGIEAQLRGSAASSAENELSAAQNAITQQNYNVGRSNFWNSEEGMRGLASTEAASAGQFGNLASSSTQEAFKDASQIQKEKGSILGALGGLIGPALSFATGGISNVLAKGTHAGTETGGGIEQFFSGGADALSQQ